MLAWAWSFQVVPSSYAKRDALLTGTRALTGDTMRPH